ncbi:glycerol-3-phosphate acyltransferase 2, mitochondrial [Pimephales promelas]|uniref:glycerol-3-phosphate acyltransferase 2, mitochondrial n=1 Tax=Pimephales promelas TaxID=90988 RepID=UPI00195576B8|nr:glycerol-3-phosphate acyltransferase 2, mitochondrial [Pimephales promelas]XP_039519350.1 glycerol-3-phosphate acyltransferase 2, mitochondrial [Pimephales promelas]KAG1930932.1 glycerol-3-phosphate acyltransferase 1, mitochondrial [Pimephales promelas]
MENPSSKTAVSFQPKRPTLSWGVKIKRKLKSVAPFLGRFRPMVGQCCHQCTPESLGLKLLCNTPPLGFQNLTCVNETHTGYRGWLVRRVCCLLFVWGREVHPSPDGDRRHRVQGSDRVRQALETTCSSDETKVVDLVMPKVRGYLGRLLDLTQTFISPSLLRIASWMLLKFFSLMFCNVQINLNQLAALHRATRLKAPLVYVCVRQSDIDHALICLTLFCHNLRVPYTIYPAHVRQTWLRSILQRLGVVLLPEGTDSERDVEMDCLYSPVMTSFIGELLREGAALSVGITAARGHGGQWLARVHQAISDGLVPDVSIVPVGVSYDCLPRYFMRPQAGVMSALRFVVSLLKGDHRGSVRIHFAQAFSLKEMCESGRCRVDGGRPLQELMLTAILNNRMDSIFNQKDVYWLLPPAVMPELPPADRQQTIALTLHLMYSSTTSMAVMSTSLVSCLLLHKHRRGVRVSVLCRDICWLLEEVLFRNTDVGFGGSLVGLVHHALSLLRPYLLMAAAPPTGEPIIAPRPDPESLLTLSQHCHLLTHVFIHEAVGACAVSAMLSEVVGCGGGEDQEFDVVLGQEELTDKSLQLTHLLSPGYIPPCQNAHSFALDVVDSLVHCGVLVMEEVQKDTPACDFMKRQGVLSWAASDNPDQSSDSDCEEPDKHSYKLSQPSQCPELLFFLCSLLSVQLRALCWALESLHYLPTPITETDCLSQLHTHLKNRAQLDNAHYESSSIDLVGMALRTFIDLGVLTEDRQREDVYLDVSPLFSQSIYKEKLLQFFKQFITKREK